MTWRRWALRLLGMTVFSLALAAPVVAHDGCEPYPVTEYSPTGIVGCIVYGEGTASMWQGPGVARNDCRWPWDACTPISITSLDTGLRIIVTPTMFGDLYTGTPDERIVDLDPRAVAALGLDPSRGLWPVLVAPAPGWTDVAMADTAVAR